MHRVRNLSFILALVVLGILITACSTAPTAAPVQPPTPTPAVQVQPTQPPAPTQTAEPAPAAAAGPAVPFLDLWTKSPHNDAASEPFKHWDTTADKMIPTDCARCHSTTGYKDFLGADGSAPDVVDKPVPIGETIQCTACHNDKTLSLTSVKFLSGVEIKNLGPEARCMECHQGRATKKQIDDQIAKFKAEDPDKVVEPIKEGDKTTRFGFINVHYFAAALTLYGTEVKGGYEYEGHLYEVKNQHVDGKNTCVGCHDPHTTQVRIDECAQCHTDVKTVDDLKNVREVSSALDYNGNGDVKEGIYAELKSMQDTLLKSIQGYAKDVAGMGIVYDPATYPYFLQDKGNTGKPDKDDKGNPIAYGNWTPRLLKAAYNYQVSVKDPGAFAHNSRYIIELLYDSIADLNDKLSTKVDMSKMHRDDAGHFAGNTMPFRDWDATGEVPAACAKCHSADGLPTFIHNAGTEIVTKAGVQITGIVGQPPANGFKCTTCHDAANFPNRLAVSTVPFPSGVSLTFSTEKDDKGNLKPVDANLCIECHQGRESTVTVNNFLANFKEADKPDPAIRFRNVHYFAAGATLFGTDAKGIYEYDGKKYVGRNMHVDGFTTCIDCHDQHALTVKTDACKGCHKVDDPKQIRMSKENYDGSKDANEPMYQVVENFKKRLYDGIVKYARDKAQVGIVYDAESYPYFFMDKDGDGKADKDDKGANIAYNAFTPRLLKAAYNYQYSVKDPGGFAHNPKYVLQALYDSIQDIGGDTSGLVRPQ